MKKLVLFLIVLLPTLVLSQKKFSEILVKLSAKDSLCNLPQVQKVITSLDEIKKDDNLTFLYFIPHKGIYLAFLKFGSYNEFGIYGITMYSDLVDPGVISIYYYYLLIDFENNRTFLIKKDGFVIEGGSEIGTFRFGLTANRGVLSIVELNNNFYPKRQFVLREYGDGTIYSVYVYKQESSIWLKQVYDIEGDNLNIDTISYQDILTIPDVDNGTPWTKCSDFDLGTALYLVKR